MCVFLYINVWYVQYMVFNVCSLYIYCRIYVFMWVTLPQSTAVLQS